MSKIKDAFEYEIEKNYREQEERGLTEPREPIPNETTKTPTITDNKKPSVYTGG